MQVEFRSIIKLATSIKMNYDIPLSSTNPFGLIFGRKINYFIKYYKVPKTDLLNLICFNHENTKIIKIDFLNPLEV